MFVTPTALQWERLVDSVFPFCEGNTSTGVTAVLYSEYDIIIFYIVSLRRGSVLVLFLLVVCGQKSRGLLSASGFGLNTVAYFFSHVLLRGVEEGTVILLLFELVRSGIARRAHVEC